MGQVLTGDTGGNVDSLSVRIVPCLSSQNEGSLLFEAN